MCCLLCFSLLLKMVLLENNWKSLLVINLVHCGVPVHTAEDIDLLLAIETANKDSKQSQELSGHYLENYQLIKSMSINLTSLKLDNYEFNSFKLIALLKTGEFFCLVLKRFFEFFIQQFIFSQIRFNSWLRKRAPNKADAHAACATAERVRKDRKSVV